MDYTVVLSVLIALMIMCAAGWLFYLQRKIKLEEGKKVAGSQSMQLQAYERLILLVDRISLPNLISRVNQPGLGARDMQLLLNHALKEEYDYNITQQIYVSSDAWSAVKNLKEQNMLVVNQLASALPPDATGLDLCKFLLEYVMNDKKGNLHEIAGEVLSFEAKKLL